MWTRVSLVARNHRLDEDEMIQFAEVNSDKYSIVNEHGYPEVNTWNCDALINDFKKREIPHTITYGRAVAYTCGCEADGHLVASYCPIHGNPVRTKL